MFHALHILDEYTSIRFCFDVFVYLDDLRVFYAL